MRQSCRKKNDATTRLFLSTGRFLVVMAAGVACLATAPGARAEMIALNWQFNESLADASGAGNAGTYYDAASGAAVYTDGIFGKAIDLSPQQMVYRGLTTPIPSAGELYGLPVAAADAWTVNLWTNLANPNPTAHTVLGGFGSDPGGSSIKGTKRFLRLRHDSIGNPLSFWGNSSGYDYDLKDPLVEYPDDTGDDAWHMVTAAFSGGEGGTLAIYLDGDLIGSVTRTFVDAPGASILVARIAGDTKTPPASTETFDGLADDFSIWNVGLTAGEIKAISNTPDCGLAELTGYDSITMEKLIDVHRSAGAKSAVVGSFTWEYVTGLSGHAAGDIWQAGGAYYVQLSDDSGVIAVPEPASLTLLLLGVTAIVVPRRSGRRR